MEPNLPAQTPTSEPVQPVIPVRPPVQSTPPMPPVPPRHKFPIIPLVVLLLIILGAGGYLGYQKFFKVQQPQASPTPTVEAVPTPTVDPATADWKDYDSADLKLNFKAPYELNVNIAGKIITIQDYPINAPPPDKFYKVLITVGNNVITKVTGPKADQTLTDQIIATFVFENAVNCVIGGCSNELCLNSNDTQTTSICIWKDQFACYATAKCEVQTDGQCGWTMDANLKACLNAS